MSPERREPAAPERSGSDVLRAALFVDFDNIFLGLGGSRSEAALTFGTRPTAWLRWLERNLQTPAVVGDRLVRRFLVRRCYLNPESFREYRPYFIRAAFEVVDCPPLTSTGKTSADMIMALDIVDTLHEATHIDEFFLLSGDADFRPVLLRLRKHDRWSTVLSIGPIAPAYRSAADHVIAQDDFVEHALGATGRPLPVVAQRPVSDDDRAVLGDIAARLDEMTSTSGPIDAAQLPAIYKEFPAFSRRTDWLGFGTLRRMTEAVVAGRTGLTLADDGEVWSVVRRENGAGEFPPARVKPPSSAGPSRAAAGRGRAPENGSEGDALGPEAVEATARRISDLTDVPFLPRIEYEAIFAALAAEMAERGYHVTKTATATAEHLTKAGIEVKRDDLGFILRGLAYRYGQRLGSDFSADALAHGFADNIEQLCARAQLSLSVADRARLRRWICDD